MKTTCLINNYNYRRFVGEAVESALAQTVPFHEIIVVDDGSTDGSLAWLQQTYGTCPAVKLIGQTNQGQLACFNEGYRHSCGELVFFLDADDLYRPEYVERALAVYERRPEIDFVCAGFQWYGDQDRGQPRPGEDADLGYSVVAALAIRAWVGAPTSCLSMRRRVLERFLPLPDCEAWKTRADDCLVFGSSLAAARKYRLAQPLVDYRIHGENAFAGRRSNPQTDYRRRLAINRLFRHLVDRLGYDPDRLVDLAHREFRTIPAPTFRQLADYSRLVWGSRLRLGRRAALWTSLLSHYLCPRRKAGGGVSAKLAGGVPGGAGGTDENEAESRPAA